MPRVAAAGPPRLARLGVCLLLGSLCRCWLPWDWGLRREAVDRVDSEKSKPKWRPVKPDVGVWPAASRRDGPTATHYLRAPGISTSTTSGLDSRLLLAVAGFVLSMVILHVFRGGHSAGHHCCGVHDALYLITEPGKPDASFGSLCLFTNVFFAALVPVFWINRKMLELVWVSLVTLASTVYHGFQLHPVHGPLSHWTRYACAGDVMLSVTFGLYIAFRYDGRRKAAPVAAGALMCFLVPSLLPTGRIAEIAYSLLHSAWHALAAAAAYVCLGSGKAPVRRGGRQLASAAKLGAFLMNAAGKRTIITR